MSIVWDQVTSYVLQCDFDSQEHSNQMLCPGLYILALRIIFTVLSQH